MITPTYKLIPIAAVVSTPKVDAARVGLLMDFSDAEETPAANQISEIKAALPPLQLVRLTADISEPDLLESDGRLQLIKALQPPVLEVQLDSSSKHDKPDAPRGDPRAAAVCSALLTMLGDSIDCLTIKPDANSWLRSHEHAVRLMMRVNRSRAGLTFSLPDWVATHGGDMANTLALVGPRLFNVWLEDAQVQQSTEAGELEKHLRLQGYGGPVGVW